MYPGRRNHAFQFLCKRAAELVNRILWLRQYGMALGNILQIAADGRCRADNSVGCPLHAGRQEKMIPGMISPLITGINF